MTLEELQHKIDMLNAELSVAQQDVERLDWLLSETGRLTLYWAEERGEPFTREIIDAKKGRSSSQRAENVEQCGVVRYPPWHGKT